MCHLCVTPGSDMDANAYPVIINKNCTCVFKRCIPEEKRFYCPWNVTKLCKYCFETVFKAR